VTPVDYKGAELWVIPGGGPSRALGKDFALLGETEDIRRCLDAHEAGTVLAKAPEYVAASGAWAGDALYATYETAAYREATEQALAKQREALRKQVGENESFVESMTMMSALPSALPATVLRDGTGVHWENSAPTAPLAGLCAYVLKQVVRQTAPREHAPPTDDEVLGLMRSLASAEATFRSREERYGTLDELSASDFMSAKELRSVLKRTNYRVEVTPIGTGDGSRFEVVATPVEYGKPGKLSFFVDDSYIIRAADKQGAPASASDAPYTYGGDDDFESPRVVPSVEVTDDQGQPIPTVPTVEPAPDDRPNE
jgi:hypothetical protein